MGILIADCLILSNRGQRTYQAQATNQIAKLFSSGEGRLGRAKRLLLALLALLSLTSLNSRNRGRVGALVG